MADREIDLLPAAEQITLEDLFVMKQGGVSKKLTGAVLIAFLTALADGHGGISRIEKTGTDGLVDAYRITLADTSVFDFNVTNGAQGPKGDNAYTWIRYASQEPTDASHSMGELPDRWMGVYAGNLATAPDDWKLYSWFEIKGKTGDTGAPATLVSAVVSYQVGTSAAEIPTGEWSTAIPETPQGSFLWSRAVYTFNSGDPVTMYSVSRVGIDGLGTLRTINDIEPDENGNIDLTAASVGALAKTGDTLLGALNANGHAITNLPLPVSDRDAVPFGLIKDLQWEAWVNAMPTIGFTSKTLTLQHGNASHAILYFFAAMDDAAIICSGEIPLPAAGTTVAIRPLTIAGTAATRLAYRNVRIAGYASAQRFVFDNAYVGSEEDNTFLIPVGIDFVRKVTGGNTSATASSLGLLNLTEDDSAAVTLAVDDEVYGVSGATVNTEPTGDTYDFTVV